MSGVQTRKQKMIGAGLTASSEMLANGHVKLNGTLKKAKRESYQPENIFMFVPNIIGGSDPLHDHT
jgi:hypothetical protein